MVRYLPDAPWTHRRDLAYLVAALDGNDAHEISTGHPDFAHPDCASPIRYVGGAVRDTLLGCDATDIDMATQLTPDEIIARCTTAGIRTIPTGIAYGTVTARLAMGMVEITTLRHDLNPDGRRADVIFTDQWHEDAQRRDFTINALYACPHTHKISDFFGGLDDLAARRVRFIGDPNQRIREDHLRILRYFRFQARFGGSPADAKAEAACADLSATLLGISRERIGMELMKLLALPDPAPTVQRMAELGILAVILPEGDIASLARLVQAEARETTGQVGTQGDALRRLAALLPADATRADNAAARLRLSKAQRKRLACAANRDPKGAEPTADQARALAYQLGMTEARDRLLLSGASTSALDHWQPPAFPLKGRDVVARGITAGPDVAAILKAVEKIWIAKNFPAEPGVMGLLEEMLVKRSTIS